MKFFMIYFILVFVIKKGDGIEWNSNNYPNPTVDFQKCNMNFSSQICDPDLVFTMNDRITINNKLKELEIKTGINDSGDCNGKGIFGVTIIGKNFEGGNSDSLKATVNDLIRKWISNSFCMKSLIIAFASDDRKVWIAGDSKVSIDDKKYCEIAENQKWLFQSGNYLQGILNIIDDLESATKKSGLSTGAIIAIVLGSIAVVTLLCILGCLCFVLRNCKACPSLSGDGYDSGGGGGDDGGGVFFIPNVIFMGGAVGGGGCGGGGCGGGGGC